MNLRVEYFYDDESRNWCFVVPIFHIVGSADSREEAEQEVLKAIDFTLWSDAQEPTPDGGEVSYLDITVQPQATAGRRVG